MSATLPSTLLSVIKGGNLFYAIILAGCTLVFVALRGFGSPKGTKRNAFPLPPGPKPLPLFGNALSIPSDEPWKMFEKWKSEYGGIIHVSVFGQSIIILNTPKAVSDLLEKRSAIYSDRPRLPLVAELAGLGDWAFSLMPYNNTWKKHRRIFISIFGPGSVQMFDSAHDFASTMLLKHFLDDPIRFLGHIRLFVVQGIMLSTYGIIPMSRDEKCVVLAERATAAFSQLFCPGQYLVDFFPILKYVPSWVPGASTQSLAKTMASDFKEMRNIPFLTTKEMMSSGTLRLPCFVSSLLEDLKQGSNEKLDPEQESVISDCALQAFGAGADTTVAGSEAFILAMILHPAIQKKAQAEIDRVVGTSRLPSPADKKDLPYVTAIMKEVLRWHVIIPQALPHMLNEDDVYEGYHLPKGTTVIGNSWGILHDADLYPDPMEFKPERYFTENGILDLSGNDPSKFAFGYGRRVCPGLQFVENTLHLAISRILATFDITPAKDENGVTVAVEHRQSSGLASHPGDFSCTISPRSKEATALIHEAYENASQIYQL